MGKKNPTTENRVYLFEALAATMLEGQVGELLASTTAADRKRAMRVLADVAFVSCVVSDSEGLDADAVRARVLGDTAPAPSTPRAAEAPKATKTAAKPAADGKSKAKKPRAKTK